jgi:trans-aconitate 2-methyltransferase
MAYLFGDTDLATRRLEVLAEVYAASTGAFLRHSVSAPPRLAVDLGCGPGHTTRLLAEVLQSEQTVGLDSSERFLALARQRHMPGVTFYLHDVCAVPFPVGPGDVLFCRLLLTHLQEPQAVMARWATQLGSHGVLLIEEVEWIHTGSAVFSSYLAMQQQTLAQQRHELYIGPSLAAMPSPAGLQRRHSQVRRVPVATAQAATMFWLNFQTWKQHPFVREHYAPAEVAQTDDALQALMDMPPARTDIEWGMRQQIYARL